MDSLDDAFNELNTMLSQEKVSLIDVLDNKAIRSAFRKQNVNLNQYLYKHILEVLDIAFGITKTNLKVRDTAVFLLTTQSPLFSSRFTTNSSFIEKINSFISKENLPTDVVNTFCLIFEFLIKSTNGLIFIHYPEREKLTMRLTRYINEVSVYDLLVYITGSPFNPITSFLIDTKAANYFLDNIKNDERYIMLLSNIVNCAKMGSKLVECFLDENVMRMLFDSSLELKNKYSFQLIIDLCKYFHDKENKFFLFTLLGEYVQKIINYISGNGSFNNAKANALVLVNIFLEKNKEPIQKNVYSLAKYLLKQFIKNPANTSLHLGYLNLFKNILKVDQSIIEKHKIREQIILLYSKKDSILASFWGILLEITKLILENKDKLSNISKWDKFISDVYLPAEKIMKEPYGGELPQPTSDEYEYSQGSYEEEYDYDYPYEEEEEEKEETKDFDTVFRWKFVSLIPKQEMPDQLDIKLISTLQKDKQALYLKFSPDGKYLAVVYEGLLEVLTFKEFNVHFSMALTLPVLTIDFTNDNSQLICCYNSKISFINIENGTLENTVQIKKCNNIKFSNDRKFVAINSFNETQIYEFPSMNIISSFSNEKSEATTAAFSADSSNLAVGYENGTVYLYDIPSKTINRKILLHDHRIISIYYDELYLFTTSTESNMKAYSLKENKFQVIHGHTSSILCLDSNGKYIITGSNDHTVNITTIKECKMEYSLAGHTCGVSHVAFSNEKLIFATSSTNCVIRVWKLKELK